MDIAEQSVFRHEVRSQFAFGPCWRSRIKKAVGRADLVCIVFRWDQFFDALGNRCGEGAEHLAVEEQQGLRSGHGTGTFDNEEFVSSRV